ncbi:MAG: tRNA modification GTPase MnmE [Lysobacteraceae bacterium]|nr:MAG: tRNA modification GTPase MnmE [Xanthomonadaceae bacterium]
MSSHTDTIAAIATPAGNGGVGIVRVSGPNAPTIAEQLTAKPLPAARTAALRVFSDQQGRSIDHGLLIHFPGDNSFTGEPVIELHGHGGQVVMSMTLARVIELGARHARPGEFSERAFLNNRMDLVQAEAIADLIEGSTEVAVRAANRSLQGDFSNRVNALLLKLVEIRVFVESAIDFPDEEIDFLAESDIGDRVAALAAELAHLLAQSQRGQLLRNGLNLVIAGAPNAGKSSLLNCLAGAETAIVTDIPGTTRDLLRQHIQIDGVPINVTDTAGLRETEDQVEAEGVRRALNALTEADHIIEVIDLANPGEVNLGTSSAPRTRVFNKIDLDAASPKCATGTDGIVEIYLSAQSGYGVELLRDHLKKVALGEKPEGGTFTARQRHVDALRRVLDHLQSGRDQYADNQAGELLAEELRLAQQALSEITGEFSNEDLLGQIFSTFCIGK